MQQIRQACLDGTSFDTIHPDYMRLYCKQAFAKACEHQHLHQLTWLYDKYPDIVININKASIFNNMCGNGNLDIAQWLADTFNLHPSSDAFRNVCRNNHLYVAKWLMDRYTCIVPCLYDFLAVCINDNTMFAQWLYDVCPNIRAINFSTEKYDLDKGGRVRRIITGYQVQSLFEILCGNQCLETAKWIHTIAPNSVVRNRLFQSLCLHDHIEVIEYIMENYANLVDPCQICRGFLEACNNNSQNTIQYLEKYTQSMDTSCHSLGKYGYVLSSYVFDIEPAYFSIVDVCIYTISEVAEQDILEDIQRRHAQKRTKSVTK